MNFSLFCVFFCWGAGPPLGDLYLARAFFFRKKTNFSFDFATFPCIAERRFRRGELLITVERVERKKDLHFWENNKPAAMESAHKKSSFLRPFADLAEAKRFSLQASCSQLITQIIITTLASAAGVTGSGLMLLGVRKQNCRNMNGKRE